MKLDSWDWSGAAPVSARVWGGERERGVQRPNRHYFKICLILDTTIVWVSPGVVTGVTNQLF